jgi:hypothetical protein
VGDKFLDRLAEIRDAQGREPMPDPSKIEGFGPGHPPVPMDLPPIPDVEDPEDGDPWDLPEGRTHSIADVAVRKVSSPMIPVAVQRPSVAIPPPTPPPSLPAIDFSTLELVVIEQEAYFRGHSVRLTLEEKALVANLVLAALSRELDDYRAQIKGVTEEVTPGLPVAVKRKRGRPRKNA